MGEEDEEVAGTIDKAKNWSAVNCTFKESKLNFRGVLSPVAFTNWLWYRCVRPKLAETKAFSLPEIEGDAYGIEDVDEILGEFMPKPKEDKKDKKDKKDEKDKKDKKDDKKEEGGQKAKPKKKAKDKVVMNTGEKTAAQNLIKNMIFGMGGKEKTIVQGWVNMIDEK